MIPEGKYLYIQSTVVSTEEQDLCEEELLWGHVGLTQRGSTPAALASATGAAGTHSSLVILGEVQVTLKGKPKASSCASHATNQHLIPGSTPCPLQLY